MPSLEVEGPPEYDAGVVGVAVGVDAEPDHPLQPIRHQHAHGSSGSPRSARRPGSWGGSAPHRRKSSSAWRTTLGMAALAEFVVPP